MRRRCSRMPTIVPIAASSSNRCMGPSIICWSATASGCGVSPARARSRQASMQFSTTIFPQLRAARRAEDELISRYIGSLRDDDLARGDPLSDRRQSAGHRADALPRARPFLQPSDASPRPGPCPAVGGHRAMTHTELRSDHLPARDRTRRSTQDRLSGNSRGCVTRRARPKGAGHAHHRRSHCPHCRTRTSGRRLRPHHPGARVGLVGRNGTGKSTLFNVIAGDISSEHGPSKCRRAGASDAWRRKHRTGRKACSTSC